MNLSLTRKARKETGVFGELHTEDGSFIAFTLEHAYPSQSDAPDLWSTKIPDGTYRCVFGDHMLKSGPVKTFMVTGVPNHEGILFHIGNFNRDSEGCILLGLELYPDAIWDSRTAFAKFLDIQGARTEFFLKVEG